MSRECIRVSDAVWRFVREGIELTEEDVRHARSCSSCASVLAEAEAGVAALSCIRPFPAAPDCRSAVMSRIATRRTRSVPAWTYACAILVIAMIIAGAFLRPHGGRPAVEQAKRPSGMANLASPGVPPAPEPKPEMRTVELEKPSVPQHPRLHQPTRHGYRVLPSNAVARAVPKPVEGNPAPRIAPPVDDSHALAYVTWPAPNQPTDSYQYGYDVADPATGEVTRCSVRREGNTIEINMESEPAEPETEPAKESKSDEAIFCG